MTKFYRVKKDNFLWKEGAIISNRKDGSGYLPVEDIWNATPANGDEYISGRIIEHEDNADFFERVYPDTVGGSLYRTKDQMIEMYQKAFK